MKQVVAKEVARALAKGAPVVALETSVVAQGLPPPHNLESALACEAAIREAGAVPAATALLDGEIRVGLSRAELERLAGAREPLLKVASRDLAIAVAGGRSGGTTVSATMEIAAAAGIRVFATGGLGGVHRGAAEHFDLSQDLWALSRFPVAVVCAGAKSVLDLPKTLEVLETCAVPVLGVGTRDFPGFYCATTGLSLEHSVEDAADGAAQMRARFDVLAQGGMVFALPPPSATALSAAEVEKHVAAALQAAAEQGVAGKAVTPFLLAELSKRTAGRSLQANLALLRNNAAFAGQLAVAYAGLGRKRAAAKKKVAAPRRAATRARR
jgi:pseudouridine-5'-phosphate glycosidase